MCVLLSGVIYAQAPDKMNYQAIVRNAANAIVPNQTIGLKISILQGTPTGTAVYEETHSLTTNSGGLITAEVGNGTAVTGTFAAIDWANGPYFIKNEIDPNGGTNYTITGTSEILSVPYAKHATTASSLLGGGGSPWTVNGADIIRDTGYVKIGRGINNFTQGNFAVGDTGNASVFIGHAGNFNEENSGRLVFTEDVEFTGTCGFEWQLNGANNTLKLVSGCSALNDTSIVFTRTGFVSIPERLHIGTIGQPVADLHIEQSSAAVTPGTAGIRLYQPNTTTNYWSIWNSTSDLSFGYNGARVSYISTAGAYTQPSDFRLKNSIEPMDKVIEKIMKLRPVEYKYNYDQNGTLVKGFIAQEVQELFPEMVSVADGGDLLALPYNEFGVLAVKAIQEQQETIDTQAEEIEALKELLLQMNKRLLELEGQ
ncbi:MAG: hypothetical protein CMP59_11410 [Flavobacteriales bacterium]|nr:hypothetical protein [Flavobacteriales bacterium]